MSIISRSCALVIVALLAFLPVALAGEGIENPSSGSSGSGTVTSVSVTTANGVSGTVATQTTTPAITLTLGAIMPSSGAFNGCTLGSNVICAWGPSSVFQAAGASSNNASTTISHSTTTTSDQQLTVVNDNGTNSTILFTNGSARDNTTLVRQASTTALTNTGPGFYLGTETAAAPVVLFEGGVVNGTNNALTISAPNAIAFNQYTTPGALVNDSSGNITSNPALAGSTACTSWTPTDQSGASLTFTGVSAQYCRIGNLIYAYGTLTYPSTADATNAKVSLPVAVPNQSYAAVSSGPSGVAVAAVLKAVQNTSTAVILGNTGNAETNVTLSLKTITFMLISPAS